MPADSRTRAVLVAILLAACLPMDAQPVFTGTWQTDVVDPPWSVALRVDGSRVTGRVSQCAGPGAVELFEGRAEGSIVTFKCTSRDGDRTVSMIGRLTDGKIGFSWTVAVRQGGSAIGPGARTRVAMFGPGSPATFTATRVADGALATVLDSVIGTELAAAVNLKSDNVKASSVFFRSNRTARVRAVLVMSSWGLGSSAYYDDQWRRTAEGLNLGVLLVTFSRISGQDAGQEGQGGIPERPAVDAVESLLQQTATEASHPEVAAAPLIIWGHSSGGQLGSRMATRLAERTLAFIHYHTNGGVRDPQGTLQKIPALLFVGGKDPGSSSGLAESAWRTGRSAGAPWTFAVEPLAEHQNAVHLKESNDLLLPWLTAVVRLRLSESGALRPVVERDGWMGDHRSREVQPFANFTGSRPESSWLPDETSARAWQALTRRF